MEIPRDELVSSGVSEGVRSVDDADTARLAHALTRLEPVLLARYGHHVGRDVIAEVRAYAWQHEPALRGMANPAGYLYRVGQSAARRYRRWEREVVLPAESPVRSHTPEPSVQLHEALARLGADDRTVVVLVHSYGYRYHEVAELLGWSVGSVRNRLHRAMARLRRELGEETERAHG